MSLGGSGGEIQAASLSCVKQKRATGQLCFRPERRTRAPSTPTLIPAKIRRTKKISHRPLLTSVEEGAAFWCKMLQKYIFCVVFGTNANSFFPRKTNFHWKKKKTQRGNKPNSSFLDRRNLKTTMRRSKGVISQRDVTNLLHLCFQERACESPPPSSRSS